jgi:hypothetical protein
MVRDRILRTGDGSHSISKMKRSKSDLNDHNNNTRDIEHFWGFGDSSMTKDDMENVKILNKSL